MLRIRREVGAPVEGLAVGGQEHGEWPPTLSGKGLNRAHVQGVDIRTFLPVHLHVHEPLVHDLRDKRIIERLPFHHMAPVARRVADRQENRAVLRPGSCQRIGPPGVPVDGIVRVLAEVGALLECQSIQVSGSSSSSTNVRTRFSPSSWTP